jgi:hypothetical protein
MAPLGSSRTLRPAARSRCRTPKSRRSASKHTTRRSVRPRNSRRITDPDSPLPIERQTPLLRVSTREGGGADGTLEGYGFRTGPSAGEAVDSRSSSVQTLLGDEGAYANAFRGPSDCCRYAFCRRNVRDHTNLANFYHGAELILLTAHPRVVQDDSVLRMTAFEKNPIRLRRADDASSQSALVTAA